MTGLAAKPHYRFVSIRDDQIELISGEKLRAYHPDDTEIWYSTLQACKEHATVGHASTFCGN